MALSGSDIALIVIAVVLTILVILSSIFYFRRRSILNERNKFIDGAIDIHYSGCKKLEPVSVVRRRLLLDLPKKSEWY